MLMLFGSCRLSSMPGWAGLMLGLVHRSYHRIHQRLLGIDVTLHAFLNQFGKRNSRKWPQQFQTVSTSLDSGGHLLAGQINEFLLRVDERVSCLPREVCQFGFLNFLGLAVGVLPTGGLGGFFG